MHHHRSAHTVSQGERIRRFVKSQRSRQRGKCDKVDWLVRNRDLCSQVAQLESSLQACMQDLEASVVCSSLIRDCADERLVSEQLYGDEAEACSESVAQVRALLGSIKAYGPDQSEQEAEAVLRALNEATDVEVRMVQMLDSEASMLAAEIRCAVLPLPG